MKHTAGPWRFDKIAYSQDLNFHIQTVDMSHKNTFIGEVGGGLQTNHEIEANARLIAAAPELLEALEEIESMKAISALPEHLHALITAMKIAAKEAIAKAKGE